MTNMQTLESPIRKSTQEAAHKTLVAVTTIRNDNLGRLAAAIDIGLYLLAAFAFYGVEHLLENAGLLPWSDLFKGAPTLFLSLFVVIALQRRHGGRLTDLGLHRPARWRTVVFWGFVVLVVSIILQLTVVPALAYLVDAPEPDFSRYDALVGNFPLFLFTVLGAMFTGGFVEEVIYRGLLMDRLARVLGDGRGSASAAAVLSGVIFGLIHFEWGFGGILITSVMGAGLAFMFLAARRNLWPLIAAHATLDLILLMTLYLGVAD